MNHIIIRGQRDAGKTTTCAVLYKELTKLAEYSKIFTMSWKEIETLNLSPNGNYDDFIAIFVVNGKVIVLISLGDIADELKKILDKLNDDEFISKIFGKKINIDDIICCARSRNVDGSTIRMLYERIPEPNDRREFWVPEKMPDKNNAEEGKKKLAEKIIGSILPTV